MNILTRARVALNKGRLAWRKAGLPKPVRNLYEAGRWTTGDRSWIWSFVTDSRFDATQATRWEMMRKALEQILQGGGLGKEAKDKANEALNMMKEVEKDIIYNRLGDHTLEKDNWITTKLLEAENAERERENENRRESR